MRRLRSAAFGVVMFIATLAVLGFLVLPIVAIFARVPLHLLLDQLDDPIVRDALVLTGTANALALAVIILFGTPTAYLLGTRRFRGRTFVITLVELPLVLPPTVAGIGLLAAFDGRIGLLSDILQPLKINVTFTTTAVVLAIVLRRRPVLRAPGHRLVRDARQGHPRRRARGRCGHVAPPAQHQHSAGLDRAGGRRRARVRARSRRVRRDDHVRRQSAGHDADIATPDLPGFRAQLRRRAGDRSAAGDHQRGRAAHGQRLRTTAGPVARRGTRRSSRRRCARAPERSQS